MVRRLSFLLAMVLVTAGCAGDGGAKSSASPTAEIEGASVGILEGRVTDEELQPLEKARVQVLRSAREPALEAFTDADGTYRFADLAEGRYQVHASQVGFREAQPKLVEVVAGETTDASFLLDAIKLQVAMVETKAYTFYFTLNWCMPDPWDQVTGGYNCQALGWDGTTIRFPFLVDEESNGTIMTIVHEMDWKTTVEACGGGMVADVYSPEQKPLPAEGLHKHPARSENNPYHWSNPQVKSPTRTYIPREGVDALAMHSPKRTELNKGRPIVTDGDWGLVHWSTYAEGPGGTPLPVGCMVDQKLNGWLSLFYVEAAAPDFSIYKQG